MDSKPVVANEEERELSSEQQSPRLARLESWFGRWQGPLLCLLLAFAVCEIAWLTFLTPGEADLAHYECYGLTFWLGSHGTSLLPQNYCAFLFPTPPQVSFHMLPQEYPPLTILLFSLPLLLPLPYYAFGFALFMTFVAGLIFWLLASSDARRAAPIFLFYLLLGTAGVFQERFDLIPALCTLLCPLAAVRGRWRLAYFALALGVLFKLYPIVMFPALFLAEQQAYQQSRTYSVWHFLRVCRWSNLLASLGLIVVVMGAFALLNFADAILSPLLYFFTRPPQIESLIGSVVWLGAHAGVPYAIYFDHGSLNITSALTRVVSPIDTLLMLGGILFLFWLQLSKRIDLIQALVGLVCVLIVTGKVFSPQYLIWLIPLLAYSAARGGTNRLWMLLWGAIALLTTFIYVFYYSQMPDPQRAAQLVQTLPGFFEVIAARNLLLVITVLAFFGNWWGVRKSSRASYHDQQPSL